MIAGLVRQQFRYITIDPYANAFNEEPNGASWDKDDQSDFSSPWLWERKYEVDSLCYPIQLAWMLYANTGNTGHFDAEFIAGVKKILDVFETEQHHERSPYFFIRDTDIPTNLKQYGVKGSDLDFLVEAGGQQRRLLDNNRKELTIEEIRNIYLSVLPEDEK